MTRAVTEIEHLGGDRYAVSDGAHLVRVRAAESGFVYLVHPDGTCSTDSAAFERWPELFQWIPAGIGQEYHAGRWILTLVGRSLFAGARATQDGGPW